MAKTPEERRASAKRARLMLLYRITPEEQARVEEFQRATRFSVLLERSGGNADAQLFTDHRHSDGLIRGRLAYLINKGLGVIEGVYKERTPSVLRVLADYLEDPPFAVVFGPRYGLIGRAKKKKKMIYGSPDGPITAPKKVGKKK
jgi:hypothetical protein